jgi:predicted 2-oxoglutarate/Fe(II)-dependent dioxygenase YbiX
MDHAATEPAEILDESGSGIPLAAVGRLAQTVDVDAATIATVESAIEGERDALAAFFAKRLVEREGPGFLRYGPGGFYGPHRDRGVSPSWPAAARRTVAVVVFLNDDYSGGALRLHGDTRSRDVLPREGTLVAFSATLLHEVVPVVDGVRDTIVDWFYEVAR